MDAIKTSADGPLKEQKTPLKSKKDASISQVKTKGLEKFLSVLCYLGIFALIPIFWVKKSNLLKTHVGSGITILTLWVILLFVFQIPLVGIVLGILLLIACLIFCVWGIYDAVSGREAKIPGIEKVVVWLHI